MMKCLMNILKCLQKPYIGIARNLYDNRYSIPEKYLTKNERETVICYAHCVSKKQSRNIFVHMEIIYKFYRFCFACNRYFCLQYPVFQSYYSFRQQSLYSYDYIISIEFYQMLRGCPFSDFFLSYKYKWVSIR